METSTTGSLLKCTRGLCTSCLISSILLFNAALMDGKIFLLISAYLVLHFYTSENMDGKIT